MRLLCLLAALALTVVLLFVALHPPHLVHPPAAFRNAACLCPACIVTDGLVEISWSEYC